jgi:hypothetical protein
VTSETNAIILGGNNNTASAAYTSIISGKYASANRLGMVVMNSDPTNYLSYGSNSKQQAFECMLSGKSDGVTSVTPLTLLYGGAAEAFYMSPNSTIAGTINVIGFCSSSLNRIHIMKRFIAFSETSTITVSTSSLGTDYLGYAGPILYIQDGTVLILDFGMVDPTPTQVWNWSANISAIETYIG